MGFQVIKNIPLFGAISKRVAQEMSAAQRADRLRRLCAEMCHVHQAPRVTFPCALPSSPVSKLHRKYLTHTRTFFLCFSHFESILIQFSLSINSMMTHVFFAMRYLVIGRCVIACCAWCTRVPNTKNNPDSALLTCLCHYLRMSTYYSSASASVPRFALKRGHKLSSPHQFEFIQRQYQTQDICFGSL